MNSAVLATQFEPTVSRPFIWRSAVSTQDIMRLRLLLRACEVFGEPQVESACAMLQDRLNNPESGYQFLFALTQYDLVGCICYSTIPFTEGRYEIHWLAVSPKEQHQGVADDLLGRIESMIKENGAKKIYANAPSRENFAPARQLFLNTGFTEETRQLDYYQDGEHRIIFSKKL